MLRELAGMGRSNVRIRLAGDHGPGLYPERGGADRPGRCDGMCLGRRIAASPGRAGVRVPAGVLAFQGAFVRQGGAEPGGIPAGAGVVHRAFPAAARSAVCADDALL